MQKTLMVMVIMMAGIIGGCNNKDMKSKTFLALGDSYTVGESVPLKGTWPSQLCQKLETEDMQVTSKIIAKTGWTTDELQEAIDIDGVASKFDIVTLLIGVNNQYRGGNIEKYREEFVSLLKQSIHFANDKPANVIVISIPDWGVTRFAEQQKRDSEKIGQEIDIFNQINKEETIKQNCHYINITDISKSAKHDTLLIAEDGLHPSQKMYTLWMERIFPVALRILNKID